MAQRILYNPWKTLCRSVLGIGLLLFGATVWAASCKGGTKSTSITAAELASVKPPRDVALGSTIFTKNIDEGAVNISCEGTGLWFDYGYVESPAQTDYNNVYETGIPGIGMRVKWFHENGVYMQANRHERQIAPWTYTPVQKFTFELVKTGPIKTGTSRNNRVSVFYHNHLSNEIVFPSMSYTAMNSGCEVAEPIRTIRLPTVKQAAFTRPGTAIGLKTFSIDLKCDKGVKVAYRIDGLNSRDHTLLNSPESGMAKGVGLILVQGGANSQIKQELGTRTEFKVTQTTVEGEALSIPLTVMYVQIDPKVEGGDVSSSATVTFFYE